MLFQPVMCEVCEMYLHVFTHATSFVSKTVIDVEIGI